MRQNQTNSSLDGESFRASHDSYFQDFDMDEKPGLLKRKDFLEIDEEAKSHPNRTYYYRKYQDVDKLIDSCTRKLVQNETNIKALFNRGNAFVRKQQYRLAITDFSKIIDIEWNNENALYHRGMAYSKMGLDNEAIADFSKVLELSPSNVSALYGRATCYNSKGLFSKAIEDYHLALTKDQENMTASTRSGSPVNSSRQAVSQKKPPRPGAKNVTELLQFLAIDVDVESESEGFESSNTPQQHCASSHLPAPLQISRETIAPLSDTSDCTFTTQTRPESLEMQSFPDQRTKVHTTGRPSLKCSPSNVIEPWIEDAPHERPAMQTPIDTPQGSQCEAFFHPSMDFPMLANFDKCGSSLDCYNYDQHEAPPSVSADSGSQGFVRTSSSTSLKTLGFSFEGLSSNNVQKMTTLLENKVRKADRHHARGYQRRQQGDLHGAIIEYTQSLECHPLHFKARFNRGFAYDKLQEFEKAIEDYTVAIELDPENAYAWYNRGISHDRAGQYMSAISDFTQAIKLNPCHADFYHNRGFCYRKQGSFIEAIEDYSQALKSDPNHFKALYNRAFSYDKLKKYEEAIRDYTQAAQLQPTNASVYHNRASALELVGKLEDAAADYRRAFELDSSFVQSLHSQGLALDKLGQYEKALEAFDKAVSLEPGNAIFHHSRGYCLRNCGNYQASEQTYSRALELDPYLVTAYTNRGYVRRKMGFFSKAVQDYSQAIQLDPDDTRHYNNRAYAHAKQHLYELAIEDYSKVIQLDPTNTHAYHNRGISYDKIGEYQKAVDDFSKVLELDTQCTVPKKELKTSVRAQLEAYARLAPTKINAPFVESFYASSISQTHS